MLFDKNEDFAKIYFANLFCTKINVNQDSNVLQKPKIIRKLKVSIFEKLNKNLRI